ncbi:MAG: hypothetical protein FJ009_19145 [Chloroflexi bacterium]|nr:hypothetical protein [Chloroflexota bacterium]
MPTPINPSPFPEYSSGVRTLGGQAPMLNARRLGWLVDSVDLRAQAGADCASCLCVSGFQKPEPAENKLIRASRG